MKKTGLTFLTLACASLLTVGCLSERHLPPGDLGGLTGALEGRGERGRLDAYRPLVGDLPVENGSLDGAIGDVRGLSPDAAYDTSGWGELDFASIYTVGFGVNGAAMTVLELDGGLDHPDLTPGARLEHDLYDTSVEPNALLAFVIGCAGEERDLWEFDQVADRTTIDVSVHPDDDDVLVLAYEASFSDWDTGERSSVKGRVDVVRSPR